MNHLVPFGAWLVCVAISLILLIYANEDNSGYIVSLITVCVGACLGNYMYSDSCAIISKYKAETPANPSSTIDASKLLFGMLDRYSPVYTQQSRGHQAPPSSRVIIGSADKPSCSIGEFRRIDGVMHDVIMDDDGIGTKDDGYDYLKTYGNLKKPHYNLSDDKIFGKRKSDIKKAADRPLCVPNKTWNQEKAMYLADDASVNVDTAFGEYSGEDFGFSVMTSALPRNKSSCPNINYDEVAKRAHAQAIDLCRKQDLRNRLANQYPFKYEDRMKLANKEPVQMSPAQVWEFIDTNNAMHHNSIQNVSQSCMADRMLPKNAAQWCAGKKLSPKIDQVLLSQYNSGCYEKSKKMREIAQEYCQTTSPEFRSELHAKGIDNIDLKSAPQFLKDYKDCRSAYIDINRPIISYDMYCSGKYINPEYESELATKYNTKCIDSRNLIKSKLEYHCANSQKLLQEQKQFKSKAELHSKHIQLNAFMNNVMIDLLIGDYDQKLDSESERMAIAPPPNDAEINSLITDKSTANSNETIMSIYNLMRNKANPFITYLIGAIETDYRSDQINKHDYNILMHLAYISIYLVLKNGIISILSSRGVEVSGTKIGDMIDLPEAHKYYISYSDLRDCNREIVFRLTQIYSNNPVLGLFVSGIASKDRATNSARLKRLEISVPIKFGNKTMNLNMIDHVSGMIHRFLNTYPLKIDMNSIIVLNDMDCKLINDLYATALLSNQYNEMDTKPYMSYMSIYFTRMLSLYAYRSDLYILELINDPMTKKPAFLDILDNLWAKVTSIMVWLSEIVNYSDSSSVSDLICNRGNYLYHDLICSMSYNELVNEKIISHDLSSNQMQIDDYRQRTLQKIIEIRGKAISKSKIFVVATMEQISKSSALDKYRHYLIHGKEFEIDGLISSDINPSKSHSLIIDLCNIFMSQINIRDRSLESVRNSGADMIDKISSHISNEYTNGSGITAINLMPTNLRQDIMTYKLESVIICELLRVLMMDAEAYIRIYQTRMQSSPVNDKGMLNTLQFIDTQFLNHLRLGSSIMKASVKAYNESAQKILPALRFTSPRESKGDIRDYYDRIILIQTALMSMFTAIFRNKRTEKFNYSLFPDAYNKFGNSLSVSPFQSIAPIRSDSSVKSLVDKCAECFNDENYHFCN